MKDSVFVIGDIHGEDDMFQQQLKNWNPDNQQLVLLGDLIDRGPDSYNVLQIAIKLKADYNAIILQGNHEQMFLDWLDMPFSNMDLYYANGGRQMIHSFFDQTITFSRTPISIADLMKNQFPEEIEFMRSMQSFYEWKDFVFVHAGINLDVEDWRNHNDNYFKWVRDPFHHGKNETGKTIVFGHTPTEYLHNPIGGKNTNIWISPCETKIGIDGGAVFGGQLHALRIKSKSDIRCYSVSSK